MTKAIVITSGKGGVGKTSVSVNVAVELAGRGHRTCLLDGDLGLANVNILLGIHPERTLDDVVFHGAGLEEILIHSEHGVDVIPGASGVESLANLDDQQLAGLVEKFNSLTGYEYLLIDTSSGISRGVVSFCLAANETLLVITAEATSLADGYAVLKVLSLNNYQGRVKVLVNRCTSVGQAKKTYVHFKSVVDKHLKIDIHPGGAVLADPEVGKAVSLQYPAVALYPEGVFAQCIRALVANLVRTEMEDGSDNGFWKRYADIVRRDLILPGTPSGASADGPAAEKTSPAEQPLVVPAPADEDPASCLVLPGEGNLAGSIGLLSGRSWPGPLPLYGHLLTLAGEERLDRQKMLGLVRHDPLLLCSLLHAMTAIPASFCDFEKRYDLESAIDSLGEDAVRRLLVSIALNQLLDGMTVKAWTAASSLWFHNCRCGLMCEELAGTLGYVNPEKAYIAGLLHDVGRVVLQGTHPEIYHAAAAPHAHLPETLAAEQLAAGQDHARLGAEILANLGFDSAIADAARYHAESPERIATALQLTRLVGIAHMLSSPEEQTVSVAVELARASLGLSTIQIFIGMQTVHQKLNRLAAGFDIPRYQGLDDTTARTCLDRLRQQAVYFATIQSTLPSPSGENPQQHAVRLLCDGLRLLFGLSRTLCLVSDSGNATLRAVAYPGCYGSQFAANVSFSLGSVRSRVVAASRMEQASFIDGDSETALADRQLLRLMEGETLFCLPLDAGGQRVGCVVCGIHEHDKQKFLDLQETLRLYCSRAAAHLFAAIR